MPLLHHSIHAVALAVAAGLSFGAPAGFAQSASDDSVWYRPAQDPVWGGNTPSEPAPETQKPARRASAVVSRRSGYYYPYGPGNQSIIIGRGGYYGRYYWPRDYRYYRRYDSPDTSTLIELARRYDPELVGAGPDAEPPTARELGERAIREGQYDQAITDLAMAADEERREQADSDQPSRQAKRLLGIAYAAAKQFENAGKHLTEAYEADPSLRTLPIRGEELFADGLELNSIVSRAVGHAHRNPSYDAWFTVAVLMQAQGKNDLANTMIERAEAARDGEQAEPSDADGDESPSAQPDPAKRERPRESEADRLRRDLEHSMERMLESQRRLEEIKRRKAEAEEAEQEQEDAGSDS